MLLKQIQPFQMELEVIDNSGASTVKFLRILHPETDRNYLLPGDIIQVAILRLTEEPGVGSDHPKMRSGKALRALVLRAKNIKEQNEDWTFMAKRNSICMLGCKGLPLCTKITGFVSRIIKRDYPKIYAMSQGSY
jgi:ribosomal protein L14